MKSRLFLIVADVETNGISDEAEAAITQRSFVYGCYCEGSIKVGKRNFETPSKGKIQKITSGP